MICLKVRVLPSVEQAMTVQHAIASPRAERQQQGGAG